MKRKWTHPESPESEGSISWRSEGQLENSKEFQEMLEREFPSSAEMMRDAEDLEQSRRDFLKLMGASTALAGFGLASCKRPESYVVPHIEQPEWQVPGKALYYATSMPRSFGATPLVATTFEGRPTKLEPNKLHPAGNGTDTFAQASILNLYDPARSKKFLKNVFVKKSDKDGGSDDDAEKYVRSDSSRAEFKAALKGLKGKKLAFVFGDDVSPTRSRLVEELGATAYRYEALAPEGRYESDGEGILSSIDFTHAKRILSLDCDFLELDQRGSLKEFYENRQPEKADYSLAKDDKAIEERAKKDLSRLYMAEAVFSLTGGLADHRKRLAPSEMEGFIAKLYKALEGEKVGDQWVDTCAQDLLSQKGNSVILLGGRYPAKLHNAVKELNDLLGANEKIVKAYKSDEFAATKSFSSNVDEVFGHEVVVWMSPGNPIYDFPEIVPHILDLVKDENKAFIHWGEREDHTALKADFHVPAANYLESWSDTRTFDGLSTLVQPMIKPLYGGVTDIEFLLAFKDGVELFNSSNEKAETPAYAELEKTAATAGVKGEAWLKARREGFYGAGYSKAALKGGAADLEAASAPTKGKLDVIFAADHSVYDGRYINNAWLQEAPDPIVKTTWDNAAWMAPATATKLGIFESEEEAGELEVRGKKTDLLGLGGVLGIDGEPNGGVGPEGESHFRTGRLVELRVNGNLVVIPVIIAFGMAENTVVLPVGYGQGYDETWADDYSIPGAMFSQNYLEFAPTFYQNGDFSAEAVSQVGVNRGFDVYGVRQPGQYFATGASLVPTKGRYSIAMVQEHQAMYGRALAREVSTMKDDRSYLHFPEENRKKAEKRNKKYSFVDQLNNVGKQGAVDSHAPQNQSIYFAKGSKTWHDKVYAGDAIGDPVHQWAMAIDLNVCNGCNACLVACQAENNIPVVGKKQVALGREMHWIRMDRYFAVYSEEKNEDYVDYKVAKYNSKYDEGAKEEYKKLKAEQEKKSNEMDWDKIGDSLELIPQPVACQQCEAAPCETVCPVNATVHTEDGINAMAYNRCIGTRYCANNCPYKARRFNFFDYNKRNPLTHKNLYKGPLGEKKVGEAPHLQRNPNVSVRMRGVMEKCNYCYQKLKTEIVAQKAAVKKKAQRLGKESHEIEIAASELRVSKEKINVACGSACSAGAITFGNLLDPTDPIRKIKSRDNELWEPEIKDGKSTHNEDNKLIGRSYNLLNYVATRPRTSYLARVKNPNPKMPGAVNIGKNTVSMGH